MLAVKEKQKNLYADISEYFEDGELLKEMEKEILHQHENRRILGTDHKTLKRKRQQELG